MPSLGSDSFGRLILTQAEPPSRWWPKKVWWERAYWRQGWRGYLLSSRRHAFDSTRLRPDGGSWPDFVAESNLLGSESLVPIERPRRVLVSIPRANVSSRMLESVRLTATG